MSHARILTQSIATFLSIATLWATTAAALLLAMALALGAEVAPTSTGPILAIPTATGAFSPGDQFLRSPIDASTELHEATVARVSLQPTPAIWTAHHSADGQSVEFPVRGTSFLKPLMPLPDWVSSVMPDAS